MSNITWINDSNEVRNYKVTNEQADELLIVALRMGYWVVVEPV